MKKNIKVVMKMLEEMVMFLGKKYSDNFSSWIKVKWCLYNMGVKQDDPNKYIVYMV